MNGMGKRFSGQQSLLERQHVMQRKLETNLIGDFQHHATVRRRHYGAVDR